MNGSFTLFRFGAVLALYAGEDIVQGGASFELERVLPNKHKVMTYLSSKPFIVIEH